MEELEMILRKRLIQKKKRVYREYLKRHPEYENSILERLKEYRGRIEESLSKIGLEPKEIREMLDEFLERLKKNLLSESIESYVELYYKDATTLKKEIEEEIRLLEKDEEMKGFINILKERLDEGLKYKRVDDILVKRLVKIAKRKGIEEAIKDETIYEEIRRLFPYEEDFREYKKRLRRFTREWMETIGKMFIPLNKEIEGLGTFLKNIFSEASIIYEIISKLDEELTEEEIQRIYFCHQMNKRRT